MKKYILVLLALLIVAYSTAQAGKPQPPGPYPLPGADGIPSQSAQAYPPPLPTPGPDDLPDTSAPTVQPHNWGLFAQISPNRWWISWDTGYPFPDAIGHICITLGWGTPECLSTHFYYYDSAIGRNWYYAESTVCGFGWYVFYSNIEGQVGTLPDYNNFVIRCIYLPDLHQQG